jgi:tryptophanyl-tRNA synthetase
VLATDPHDVDVAEPILLVEVDDALLEEFEQGEEPHDHLEPLDQPTREPGEADPTDTWQFIDELGDRIGDAGPDRGDMEQIDARHRAWGRGAEKGGANAMTRHTLEQIGHQALEAVVRARLPRKGAIGLVGQTREDRGDVFEGLALEQPGQQQIALLPERELVVEIDVVAPGEQTAGLELDERRGDEQELRGHVEVERLHPFDLGDVAVDDAGQRDLVDVDLLLQDQVQEQIEWALVDRGRHIDRHGDNLARAANSSSATAQQSIAWLPVTRVLSCIQPTGDVHLGNYLGALRNWVVGQHEADVFHGIVDLHALTVTEAPGVVGNATIDLAAWLFAVGLDPDVATVFVQSHVPEHSQLAWLMECTVSFGELSRMTQYKDKAAKREGEFISAGLFTYPALMAADILLYDADEVPVGDDQRQHVEITRDIAIRFNSRFGTTFTLPRAVMPRAGARVMDLQEPTSKMSKSAATDTGLVRLTDEPSAIAKKFKRAVTDSESEVRYDRSAKPGVSNLLDILAACTGDTPEALAARYTQYGPLKVDTGDAVVEMLAPIQERYRELMADRAELGRLLAIGADRARAVASATLQRAYDHIGLLPR